MATVPDDGRLEVTMTRPRTLHKEPVEKQLGLPDADEATRAALLDSGEGTLDLDGRPTDPDDVHVLQGLDEEDWSGLTGP